VSRVSRVVFVETLRRIVNRAWRAMAARFVAGFSIPFNFTRDTRDTRDVVDKHYVFGVPSSLFHSGQLGTPLV
jgi:hypothetical protein